MIDPRTMHRFLATIPAVAILTWAGCDSLPVAVTSSGGDVTVVAMTCTADENECPEGTFCQFADGTCDDAVRVGTCATTPEACADIFQPVCGCDGMTYGNECEAELAGVAIAADGECVEG